MAARKPALPRLAVFSPLPPAVTGVADYTAELLPHLSRHFSGVDAYVDDRFAEHPRDEGTHRVVPVKLFEAVDAKAPYDAVLYHHGNNPLHEYLYRQALRRRGIALLHDPVLHHYMAYTLGQGKDPGLYAEELRYCEGEAGALLAKSHANGLLREWHKFLVPMSDRVLAHSEAVIVHGAYAERLVRTRFPDLPLTRVPHHYSPPRPEIDRLSQAEARRRVGVSEGAFLVGSFGFVSPAKRVEKALEAFARFARAHPDARYVIVGELLQFDRALVERLGIAEKVHFAGRVNLDDFQTWMIAVDVVVNLRYPSAGESSGSLVRSLGAGKPTLVSRMPYCADHPLDLTIQVPVGDGEVEALQAAFERLKSEPGFARELGAAARAYARVRCTLELCAEAQARVVYECMARRGLPVPAEEPAGGLPRAGRR